MNPRLKKRLYPERNQYCFDFTDLNSSKVPCVDRSWMIAPHGYGAGRVINGHNPLEQFPPPVIFSADGRRIRVKFRQFLQCSRRAEHRVEPDRGLLVHNPVDPDRMGWRCIDPQARSVKNHKDEAYTGNQPSQNTQIRSQIRAHLCPLRANDLVLGLWHL